MGAMAVSVAEDDPSTPHSTLAATITSDASDVGSARSAAPPGSQMSDAQAVVKQFVRGMVKGRAIHVLSTSGGKAECIAFLDKKLTMLSLQRAGKEDAKKRAVPLEDIAEIAV